jgi:hypothetical protein
VNEHRLTCRIAGFLDSQRPVIGCSDRPFHARSLALPVEPAD